jgi:hypothetical protein
MKKILSLVMALTLLCLPLEGVFAEGTRIISSKSEQVKELEKTIREINGISSKSEQVKELEKTIREINGISSKSEQVKELEKTIREAKEKEYENKKEAEEESWEKWFRKNKSMVVKSVGVVATCVCVLDTYAGFNTGRLRQRDIQENRLHEQHSQTRLGFIKETVAKWVICKALDAGWTCVKNSVAVVGISRVWSLFRSNIISFTYKEE